MIFLNRDIVTVEVAREIRMHNCDFKHGEEIVYESHEQMLERMEVLRQEIQSLIKDRPGQKILLVAHHNTIVHFTWDFEANDGTHVKNAEMIEYE